MARRPGARLRAALQALRRAPSWTIALTLVWAAEIFLVQELTLIPMHWMSLLGAFTYRAVRVSLDLLACAGLVCWLPRPALLALFAANTLFDLTVVLYHDYYQQPLSIHAILDTGGEGVQVRGAVLGLVESWHAIFLAFFVIKASLLLFRSPTRGPWAARRRPALILGGVYLGVVALVNPLLQPLHKIGTWDSVGGLGAIYGYGLTWAAEYAFIDVADLRERAVTRSREALPADVDRLVTDESPFPVGERLVFLQVESLDAALLDFTIGGREVTPNLNRLWREGRRYRVQAPKGTGSSDADFRALTGVVPSRDVPTYKIPGYPYDGSFVHRLHRRGYRSAAIHGVTGEFFNRRRAYEEMPWDDLLFREEFLGRGLVDTEAWAVDDARLLEVAAGRLADYSGGPDFELVITATSHIPFPLAPERRVFFPDDTRDRFAYFDSIHYVDAAIGEFMAALPPGTTVVLYGDHVSKMENPELGYRQQLLGEDGCVPFLILESGADLSPGQRVGPEGDACTLTSLHTFRYVHQVVLAADTGEVAAAGDAGGARAIEAPAPAAPGARVTTSAGVGP